MKKIVLAEGAGLIGEYQQEKYEELNYEVKIISRQPQNISWEYKQEIMQSRVPKKTILGEAGFQFTYLTLNKTLEGILNQQTRFFLLEYKRQQ